MRAGDANTSISIVFRDFPQQRAAVTIRLSFFSSAAFLYFMYARHVSEVVWRIHREENRATEAAPTADAYRMWVCGGRTVWRMLPAPAALSAKRRRRGKNKVKRGKSGFAFGGGSGGGAVCPRLVISLFFAEFAMRAKQNNHRSRCRARSGSVCARECMQENASRGKP